ncbi:MAG: anthranilate phosphoribosyltransferase, partial [Candidatus Firestonebacteria bacterium]|nr:anthranilate phosphoribosyltransferase [Candidatus Firestonebacteria bacterium]
SQCGSADVLEALGVNLTLKPEQVRACIAETGIGFLFAPLYHLAMKHAGGPRKEIGIRTIFNLLGPLANPAGANVQVLGVYEKELTPRLAEVLRRLGLRRAMVVHGHGTLDEFSLFGPTQVSELKDDRVNTYTATPSDFGFPEAQAGDLAGGDASHNAAVVRDVLAGKPGPKLNAVLMNAAAVFVVAGRAPDFKAGVKLAQQTITSGKAAGKLRQLAEVTQRLAAQAAEV